MKKCDTYLTIGHKTQVDIIDTVTRSLGVGAWKRAAVCADLSPIMIRGLEPNLRRIKLPNREKSLCFPIDVRHWILRKMAFSYRGLRTFVVLPRTDTYWSKSVVEVECELVCVSRCSAARISSTLS